MCLWAVWMKGGRGVTPLLPLLTADRPSPSPWWEERGRYLDAEGEGLPT